MPASSGTCGPNLGTDAGPELPEAAMWALESWKDGARSCSLEPLAVERTVYCFDCGYAGTLDLYARVKGVLTVLYPEAFLQNVAYRHAAERGGLASAERLIVRLLTTFRCRNGRRDRPGMRDEMCGQGSDPHFGSSALHRVDGVDLREPPRFRARPGRAPADYSR